MKSSISFSVSNSSTASVVFIITTLLRRREKRRKKQRLLGIDDDFDDEELGVVLVIITLSFVPIFYTTSSSFPSLSFEEKKCDDRKQQHSVLSFCTILLQILGVRSFLFSELLLFSRDSKKESIINEDKKKDFLRKY
tara:strand:+ start:383 stop:793 length:411 start_codon:yes stop_codon:yes gene_type:complete